MMRLLKRQPPQNGLTVDRYMSFVGEMASTPCDHPTSYDNRYCYFCCARQICDSETREDVKRVMGRMMQLRSHREVRLVEANNKLRDDLILAQFEVGESYRRVVDCEEQLAASRRHPIEQALVDSPLHELTTKNLAEVLSKNSSWVTREANKLVDEGLVVVDGTGRANKYSLPLPTSQELTELPVPKPPSLLDNNDGVYFPAEQAVTA